MRTRKERWATVLEDRAEAWVMKLAAILIAIGLLLLTAAIFWHIVTG